MREEPEYCVIWTREGCEICHHVKMLLEEQRTCYIDERNADDLVSGGEPNLDAMAQLASQNMMLPVVQIDGEFVNPATLVGAKDHDD